jgi:hypothetical protein
VLYVGGYTFYLLVICQQLTVGLCGVAATTSYCLLWLCAAMLCYVMLCYAEFMLCYATYAMLCYAVTVLCYAMLYAMLCYAMHALCYAMLCYVCYSWVLVMRVRVLCGGLGMYGSFPALFYTAPGLLCTTYCPTSFRSALLRSALLCSALLCPALF